MNTTVISNQLPVVTIYRLDTQIILLKHVDLSTVVFMHVNLDTRKSSLACNSYTSYKWMN